ncbi:MAG: SH3 domain-containing protein [Lachnospiraceae bacterium]|nr:SH3 domain-containing protein [Lachnospiraceae bacterium]
MEKKKQNYIGRYGLAFLLVALLFVAMQMMVHATADDEGGQTATVKAGKTGINVRSSAGTNGAVVGKVDGGETYDVIGSAKDGEGKTWYEISGTKNGGQIKGYIREDFVDIKKAEPTQAPEDPGTSEGDDAPTEPSGGDETPVTGNTVQGSILAMDPPAGEDGADPKPPVLPAGFYDTRIRVGDREVQAWTNDTFYIFYANSPSGNVGWFLYDSAEGRWVRFIDFLIEEGGNTGSASANTASGGGGKGIIIVLIILVVLLAGACAFLAIKVFGGGRDDYYDDDDDDDYRPARRQASSRPAQSRPTQSSGQRVVQSRPQSGTTQRPAGAAGVQRPAGARPAGAPGVQRPAGAPGAQRPAGAPGAQRPAGAPGVQRPAGVRPAAPAGQPAVRRQSQPGGAPVTRRTPQGAPVQRTQPGRQSRPMDDDEE